jgi:filamentous hemagglutinin
VTINGTSYTVIRKDDSRSLGSALADNGQSNINHAEVKLGSYINDKFGNTGAVVDIAVQNTSAKAPGMCAGCAQVMPNLSINNPNIKVNLYQGSTGAKP